VPDDVWNVPGSYPATPAPHATEGFLNFSGFTATPVYYEEAGIRAAKQILGCDYYDGAVKTTRLDVEDVEAGRFDDARRLMYDAYKRLNVLAFLLGNWPYGWSSLYNGTDEIGLNYGWYHSFAADGKGTTVYINWTDSGADTDARKMMLNSSYCPVHPGCVAVQSLNTSYGMAIVTAVNFLGQAGTTHRAKLTLHRPLDADTGGRLWIILDDKLDVLPAFPLRVSDSDLTVPKQCKHAIFVDHTVYSSFKSAYPTLPACSGIHGQWFCGKLDQAAVDLSYFVAHSGRCHNTACPLWEPQAAWYPGDGEAYTKFWLARGRYIVELWPGALQDEELMNLVKLGKDDFTGLGALLGWPIGYWSTGRGASVYIEDKIYSGIGGLLFLTGNTTAAGYLEMLNWDQIQTQRVADGDPEDDNVGIIEGLEVVTKADPAGGASYASRELKTDRPGYDFERSVGVRRLGHIGMGQDSVPAGAGLNGVQCIRPRKFTSAEFALPYVHPNGSLTNDNGETRLTFFAEAQSIGSVDSGDEFSTLPML